MPIWSTESARADAAFDSLSLPINSALFRATLKKNLNFEYLSPMAVSADLVLARAHENPVGTVDVNLLLLLEENGGSTLW